MYKVYQNKSSLKRKSSRILQGGTSYISGTKIAWWDMRNIRGDDIQETQYTVTLSTAGRPDLIAFDVYANSELEWVVLQYNNIVDVLEELVIGKQLLLPSRAYINTNIITKPSGINIK